MQAKCTSDGVTVIVAEEEAVSAGVQQPGGGQRLVYRDGVHLFSPESEHHTQLAQSGRDSETEGALLPLPFSLKLMTFLSSIRCCQ